MDLSLCFNLTGLDPFGTATFVRPWDDNSNSLENAKRRMHVAFEFMSKLGVRHWTFHDRYTIKDRTESSVIKAVVYEQINEPKCT